MRITSIEVHVDPIEYPREQSEPDLKWMFVDALGREHRWVADEIGGHHLPTLESRSDLGEKGCYLENSPCPGASCENCDEFGYVDQPRAQWYVPETDEVVVPGYRTRTERCFVQGLRTCVGTYESDEIPDLDTTYDLENCDTTGIGGSMHGNILVKSYKRHVDGVFRGEWVATGEVTTTGTPS